MMTGRLLEMFAGLRQEDDDFVLERIRGIKWQQDCSRHPRSNRDSSKNTQVGLVAHSGGKVSR